MPREPTEILTRCLGGKTNRLPREKILSFAEVSPQPCAIAFIKAIRTIPKLDLKQLPFEAMCVYAQVNPVELLGAILMAAKCMKRTEGALKAIMSHPDVVDSTIKAATDEVPIVVDVGGKRIVVGYSNGDIKAQGMLHEAIGFLQSKKGGGDVNINFGFGRPPEERDEGNDADKDWDEAFPPLGSEIKTWSAEKHKLLEAKVK